MKTFNLKFNILTLTTVLTTSVLMTHVAAAPGTIATQPLQTSASAESNVMFVLDSSGSMDIISPEPVPDSYSYTCTDATAKIPDGTSLELNVQGGGASSAPKIRISTTNYDLGNTSSTRCFDPDYTYYANLNDDLSTDTWNQVPYDGNYLNWYFDTSTDSGSDYWDTNDYKPGAKTRLEVAQSSLNGLIDTLKSVNVGLTTFDTTGNSNGASIIVPIAAINTSHATTLKNAVTATDADGGTPLAETLRDIGRYFASGDGNNGSTSGACGGSASTNLWLYPDDVALNTSVACDTLFTTSYTKDSDVTGAGPTEHFCQKNFAVMLTDGFSTSDDDIPDVLKDYDQDCPDPADPDTYTCTDDVRSTDTGPSTGYWDDVAQALYEIDLRPDLNNQQGNFHKNNLSTYTIGFADKQIENLQLIKDVATQGGGENYYASSSADLETILTDINAEIEGQSGTAAAVTFNSSTLSSQSAVYQALFNTQRWSGQLRSIPLDGFTGDVLTNCTEGSNNCWYAEKMLDAQSTRTILTYNPVSKRGVDFAYNAGSVDYTTITSSDTTSDIIPKTMIDDFCASHDIPFPCNASTAADSAKVSENMKYMGDLVAYLRGERKHEADAVVDDYNRDFRFRAHKLGDVVNSSPVYVGKPSVGWPSTAPFPEYPALGSGDPDNTYNTWASTGTVTGGSLVKDRMPIVYVAANDGMLHGFRTEQTNPATPSEDAGEEVLAFIPSTTAGTTNTSGLHYLANPDYQHHFYVDLNPALSDVYIKHRDTTSGAVTADEEWRTVVIGGQGAGGNTMFMLDVTDPNRFSATNVKELIEWEFNQPNLGYTYSKPTIAMMNNGRFAAIFGNGYNSSDFGGDCKAKLFVVFLDGGVDGTWTAGTDYYEYDTTIGTDGNCNGLSSPAIIDLNGDRVADKAYAGDLYGNLWVFDLCNYDSATSACQTTGWGLANSLPLMTAVDDGSPAKAQPITVKPVVSLDPASVDADSLIIAFGTGQYLASNDVTNTDVQSFYAVRDDDAIENGVNADYGLEPRKSADKFKEQIITEQACTQAGCTGDVRVITDTNMVSNDNGWFIDFNFDDTAGNPVDGERMVVNPKIRSNTLFFNTVKPDARKCYAGGNGWLMSVNLKNGGRPLSPVFDLNNDGVFDSNDQQGSTNPAGQKVFAIPAESTFLGDNQYTPDSEGNISKRKVNIAKNQREGRMSWKELFEDN